MKLFLESLKPELELAEKHNCTLAIENHSGKSLLNKLDSFRAFTDLNQHPRLGIALAPTMCRPTRNRWRMPFGRQPAS